MAWPTKLAILRTKAYARIFNYRLTPAELQRFLITTKPLKVNQQQWQQRPYSLVQLWLIRLVPWVKLAGLTGARAMSSTSAADDIDLMIVTAKNRLWLSRLLLTILLWPWLRRGNKTCQRLCLNLWLDETALSLPVKQRNLFTAHEICQLQPLYNRDQAYQRFIRANLWFKNYLANWTP